MEKIPFSSSFGRKRNSASHLDNAKPRKDDDTPKTTKTNENIGYKDGLLCIFFALSTLAGG